MTTTAKELAERLRRAKTDFWAHERFELLEPSAALILSQAERIERLEEALNPFADVAEFDISEAESDGDIYRPMSHKYAVGGVLKVGDLRRTKQTMEE